MAYGLLPTGFAPKTLEILIDEVNAELRDLFGPSIDLEYGVLARIVRIICERYSDLWELAEAVNASQNPDAATGVALEVLSLLTATFRIAASYSTTTLTLTGTPATSVLAGQRVGAASSDAVFLTSTAGTITALPSWTPSTLYYAGARVTNVNRVFSATSASGTSAAFGGPTLTGSAISDGSVVWAYCGDGTGAADVSAQATETGPVPAAPYDLTEIQTPVGGWSGVTNLLTAALGLDYQEDESLRVSREEALSQAGTGTADAIRAEVLRVPNVVAGSVVVFVNDSDVTNSDGMPPHSVEVLVRGGADEDIARALIDSVAAGIRMYGDMQIVVQDDEGNNHAAVFSRPIEKPIYVDVFVDKDVSLYPADGDDLIKAAIVAYGDAQKCGRNAVASALSAQAFKVAGVLDVTNLELGLSASPSTSTPIAIAPRELATYDVARITVTATPAIP